jgi:hypothetical protein
MGLFHAVCDIPARLGNGTIDGHANVRASGFYHGGPGVRNHDSNTALFVNPALRTVCIFDPHRHSLYPSTESPQRKDEPALDVCAQNIGYSKTLSTNLNLHVPP